MNTNKSKRGFSFIGAILICLAILLFLFIIMGIVKKSTPNLNPLYDSIFRDNINSMQDAGEAYFTNDKLPTEEGQEVKLTLQEMLDKNYILPFTDKNGDACDLNKSYVKVVKTKDGYELRTFLKCGEESHEIVKVLGCHDLCEDCNKEKTCTREKITQYQFVKNVKSTKTTYSCTVGKLNGKNCTDTVAAKVRTITKTDSKSATKATIKQAVDTVVTKTKKDVNPEKITTPSTTEKKYVEAKKEEKVVRIYTDPDKKVETTCTTVKEKDPNCTVQCVPTYVNGVLDEVCNTCGYVYHKKCTDTDVWVCPNGYLEKGSGSSKTCYKDVTETTYKCPSDISKENQSGSGKNLKCWYYVTKPGTTTYKCPSNISKENQSGSGKNLKCWYYTYTYSCPSTSNYSEGSGKNLKCYAVSTKYSCDTSNGWTLKDKTCYKTTTTKSNYCASGYSLSGSKCIKTVKAKVTKKTVTKKAYKWSTSETLSGWTRTGKTKEVEGKEVCE